MSEGVRRHRELERKLRHVRWLNQGLESEEEERLLDEMEALWWELSERERGLLDKDDPTTLVRSRLSYCPRHRISEDSDVWAGKGAGARALREVS
jgi:hypothetical protein